MGNQPTLNRSAIDGRAKTHRKIANPTHPPTLAQAGQITRHIAAHFQFTYPEAPALGGMAFAVQTLAGSGLDVPVPTNVVEASAVLHWLEGDVATYEEGLALAQSNVDTSLMRENQDAEPQPRRGFRR